MWILGGSARCSSASRNYRLSRCVSEGCLLKTVFSRSSTNGITGNLKPTSCVLDELFVLGEKPDLKVRSVVVIPG